MNRLRNATSPYLLQHADNPVYWQPWDTEALDEARRQDRPILLSIGYSACHWCHVMAHESFEDEQTAELMNRLFVNIKVDREERPDLDRIYQTAHQLLAQRPGGWPLTVFLSPEDQVPFFAGTYFPARARFGLPGFRDLLLRVEEFYRQEHAAIRQQSASLRDTLAGFSKPGTPRQDELHSGPLDLARRQLQAEFDERHGGFGRAPKFPHPGSVERLLRHYQATLAGGRPDRRALDTATFTLQRMARGGLQDQIGGGFCRYSVDDLWMIPHFEKMLYDNGQLLSLYADAAIVTGDPYFARVCAATATWAIREMQEPDGAFRASVDADSAEGEGRFYTWTPAEVEALLSPEQYAVVASTWGLDRESNFEGRWHLHGYRDERAVAGQLGLEPSQVVQLLDQARDRLYAHRASRPAPALDDKILTAWNGLMIKGLARAGRLLQQPDWVDAAARALHQLQDSAWTGDRLLATRKGAAAQLNAYLDDYAFVLDALIEMLQARWNRRWLDFALDLADALLARFEDPAEGGFYFTSHDHEQLIQRPRDFADDAIPSGNGIAASSLLRIGHLVGEQRYLDAAERTLRAGWHSLQRLPHGHAAMLVALEEFLHPPPLVVMRGAPGQLREWQAVATARNMPGLGCYAVPADETALPGLLAERRPLPDRAVAYVCAGARCLAPADSRAALARCLDEVGGVPLTP